MSRLVILIFLLWPHALSAQTSGGPNAPITQASPQSKELLGRRVATTALRVYTAPGSNIYWAIIEQNQWFIVDGNSPDGAWARVKLHGNATEGWIPADVVRKNTHPY